MARRTATLLVSAILVVVLAAGAAVLDVPYVVLQPGPTANTLGAVAGQQLITIEGHPSYPADGHLNLTTVSVIGGPGQRMDLLTALRAWLNRNDAVVPEDQLFPKGQTAKQADEENSAEMTQSQEDATAAALTHLGIPYVTKVTVQEVAKGAPEGTRYEFFGDEHGKLILSEGAAKPPLGSSIECATPHCDPTVNLYDVYHVVRGDTLIDIWPIEARGKR